LTQIFCRVVKSAIFAPAGSLWGKITFFEICFSFEKKIIDFRPKNSHFLGDNKTLIVQVPFYVTWPKFEETGFSPRKTKPTTDIGC